MDNEFEYLVKRANLFFEYLDNNNIQNIFPYREASKKELRDKIASGSVRKLRIWNEGIDNLIIGDYFLGTKIKFDILDFFHQKLGEDKSSLIDKKLKLYRDIKEKGFIKSRIVIGDAIEIANSDILGLTQAEKDELQNIISDSMSARIPKNPG
jgi:hypothetical protein